MIIYGHKRTHSSTSTRQHLIRIKKPHNPCFYKRTFFYILYNTFRGIVLSGIHGGSDSVPIRFGEACDTIPYGIVCCNPSPPTCTLVNLTKAIVPWTTMVYPL